MALAGPALALADFEAAALAEQTKVSAALLFESICKYAHNMAQYENPAANDFLTQENLRGNFNCLGAYLNELFWSSVRFRNYMRYGVAQQLLNRQVGDAAGAAEEQFDYPTLTMLNGIPMFSWTTGLPPQNLANSHLPWKKILPNENADPARSVRPMQSTANYSAFDISSSVFSNMGADPVGWVTQGFDPVKPWMSQTVFHHSHDNCLAFLRECGEFLSPNHFHRDNEGFRQRSVGSFLGSNIILTSEMLDVFLRHKNGVPPPVQRCRWCASLRSSGIERRCFS